MRDFGSSSKKRFEHPEFKKKLQQARNYKRGPALAVDKKNLERSWVFFTDYKIWGGLIVVAALVYLFFLPNVFEIKRADINGIPTELRDQVKQQVYAYLNSKKLIKSDSFLLLSPTSLEAYILKNNPDILSVTEVKKIFPNSLMLNLSPRQNCFTWPRAGSRLTVSCDGVVMNQDSASSNATTLVEIRLPSSTPAIVGEKILSNTTVNALSFFSKTALPFPNSAVEYFEISNGPEQLTIHADNPQTISLLPADNLNQTLQKLQQIANDLNAQQKEKIFYIDLRLKDKGFVCLTGTPCSNFQAQTNTTTPPIINP